MKASDRRDQMLDATNRAASNLRAACEALELANGLALPLADFNDVHRAFGLARDALTKANDVLHANGRTVR